MRSLSLSPPPTSYAFSLPRLSQSTKQASLLSISRFRFDSLSRFFACKLNVANFGRQICGGRHRTIPVRAFDGDSFDFSSLNHWDSNVSAGHTISSSEGEDSDGEHILNLVAETTAQRLARLSRDHKRHRIRYGMFINLGLIIFLIVLLFLVDCYAWKIVRLPLAPFLLSCPFFVSAALVFCAGYVCVPLLNSLKIPQIIRRGPVWHSRKRKTPTMGGLFFVPIGIAVAIVIAGCSSAEVSAAVAATLAFAAIGLVDDTLSLLNNDGTGLSAWLRIVLETAVGIHFSFWLDATSISSPYGMKLLVPLPAPLGLVCLGKFYLLLTSFCFVSMGNSVKLTDGLDGLAGGVAALAFLAMSIAVLPICSDLAVFGASMAGACIGFLLHNRYRASVFMGGTGSLALGAALAAMAACTGMFFPLFISSGIFVLEASSVIIQVVYFRATKWFKGAGRRFFRMAPFHHHLELCGLKEPVIVGVAYIVSCILSLFAAYVGLISA